MLPTRTYWEIASEQTLEVGNEVFCIKELTYLTNEPNGPLGVGILIEEGTEVNIIGEPTQEDLNESDDRNIKNWVKVKVNLETKEGWLHKYFIVRCSN